MSVSQVPDEIAVSSTTPPDAPVTSEASFATTGLRKISVGLLLVYVAILAINSGGLGILIPNLVANLDAADKVDNLALVTTVAFFVNVFAQPIAGALSDATRSRFGRRTPWMVGGGLLAAGFLIGLPMAGSVVAIAVVWMAVQLGVNALQAAATALVPDRFPPSSAAACPAWSAWASPSATPSAPWSPARRPTRECCRTWCCRS